MISTAGVVGLARFLTFAGAAVLFGLVPVCRLVLAPGFAIVPAGSWRRARALLVRRLSVALDAALGAVVVAALVTLAVQVWRVHGLRGGSFPAALAATVDTGFGRWTALRIVATAALAIAVRRDFRDRALAPAAAEGSRVYWGTWTALAVLLLATLSLTGHAAAADPVAVAVAVDVLHLAAGSTWLTGITVLALGLPVALRQRRDRAQLQLLVPTLRSFSRLAVVAVLTAGATGVVNALVALGSFSALRQTGYGQALVVKVWLFAWVLALGGVNHFVLLRRLAAAATRGRASGQQTGIAVSVAAECLFGAVLLAVTAVLTGLPRPV